MTFLETLTLVLMVLKLTGVIEINWFIVIVPVLVEFILAMITVWGDDDD